MAVRFSGRICAVLDILALDHHMTFVASVSAGSTNLLRVACVNPIPLQLYLPKIFGKQKKNVVDQFDSSDTDGITSTSTGFSDLRFAHETENVNSLDFVIDKCLDSLDNRSSRLKALKELLDTFEGHMLLPYLENRFVTLLNQYMNSMKKAKGYAMEACLASRAIGFLAITVGMGTSGKEIMEQSLSHLEKVIVSGNDAVKISVLDTLAIVTFVGANNWDETAREINENHVGDHSHKSEC